MEQQTKIKGGSNIKILKSIPRKKASEDWGQHARRSITDVIKEDGARPLTVGVPGLPGVSVRISRPLRVLH